MGNKTAKQNDTAFIDNMRNSMTMNEISRLNDFMDKRDKGISSFAFQSIWNKFHFISLQF